MVWRMQNSSASALSREPEHYRGAHMTILEGSIEWPDFAHYSDTPIFNTKAVVQQTGVPAPTLRAWERRYKLISPERADNTYRLYSQRDIALIRWLKERVDGGISISHAIALYHHMIEEEQQNCANMPSQPGVHIESQPMFQVTISPPTLLEDEQESLVKSFVEPPPEPKWPIPNVEYSLNGYPSVHNIQVIRQRIIDAFQHFDETTANILMSSMLAIYPVEQICTELITPTMWRIGQLWSEGELTVSVEHFASNFFRALLTNLFHVTPGPHDGPLVIVCCAPGEPHELATLMLALFLRRSGIRVIYLGQSIEIAGLLHTIKLMVPAMVCISLTMPIYLSSLISLAQQIQRLPEPRPLLAFGGQAFSQYGTIVQQIPGLYLHGDMRKIAIQLRSMVLEHSEDSPRSK